MERHHLIPLSCPLGLNHDCNIIELTQAEHRLVHSTLNIPYDRFIGMWREYRKKHNHKLAFDYSQLWDSYFFQKEYFKNIYDLPGYLVKKHTMTMVAIVDNYCENVPVRYRTIPEHPFEFLNVHEVLFLNLQFLITKK